MAAGEQQGGVDDGGSWVAPGERMAERTTTSGSPARLAIVSVSITTDTGRIGGTVDCGAAVDVEFGAPELC